jgi:5-oxoprolinase (ATP-hydrolysing)
MGGTSTDVCHYAGTYERSFETEVAGVRMRAPMMHIHTVAAGGGSILSSAKAGFQVGPESAGADPGPACYRKGGPLTVTDCNVMLGKLHPVPFSRRLRPECRPAARHRRRRREIRALADEIGDGRSPHEVAEGFLRIAVENMANAIKKISVQRGYDVTKYALASFGGAGGQHACLVADALGMTTVILHPFAGVLSAYGMGLADIRAIREVQFDAGLDRLEQAEQRLRARPMTPYRRGRGPGHRPGPHPHRDPRASEIRRLPPGARRALRFRRRPARQVRGRAPRPLRLRLRRPGSSSSTCWRSRPSARRAASAPLAPPDTGDTDPWITSPYIGGGDIARHADPIARDDLPQGARIAGPAIVSEATGTTMIEPGWPGGSTRSAT